MVATSIDATLMQPAPTAVSAEQLLCRAFGVDDYNTDIDDEELLRQIRRAKEYLNDQFGTDVDIEKELATKWIDLLPPSVTRNSQLYDFLTKGLDIAAPVARKLADTTPTEFDAVIQDAAEAAGAESAFADVRTEEISVAGSEDSDEEEETEDDASTTSKFASVKFIASVAAGCFCLAAALAVRWCLLHRRGKKTRAVVIEYPRLAPIKERPGAPVAYARPVASAPPLAPLAPEPPLASIKERALAEAAAAPEPAPAGEYDPER